MGETHFTVAQGTSTEGTQFTVTQGTNMGGTQFTDAYETVMWEACFLGANV